MITKAQFDSLFSEDITKKQYDVIIAEIDKRFHEICKKFIHKESGSDGRGWYDYGNVSYDDENSEGYFDPEEYKENIQVGGEWIDTSPGYDAEFPTRWLWEENWEEEMKQTSEKYKQEVLAEKQKKKQQRETKKQQAEILKRSIKAKLTSEELKIVRFK